MGVPRIHALKLAQLDTDINTKEAEKISLNSYLSRYNNPAIYPHKEFYERAYSEYRNGKALDSPQYVKDLELLEKWLSRLVEDLAFVKKIVES